jgi:transcriptional regulator with XRE-family HTH domain
MGFVQKRIQHQIGGFGADLKELRELRGYSLERLSKISGMHVTLISAFEEERLQDIADPVYAERHIRTLAKILEGREEFYLQKYRKLLEHRLLAKAPERALRPRIRRSDLFVTSRLVMFCGFVIVVIAIGAYVAYAAREIVKAPILRVTAPIEGAIAIESSVAVQGETDPQASVIINGQKIIVDDAGTFFASINIPSGVSTIRIEARRRYGKTTVIERHVMFERSEPKTEK